MSSRIVHGSYHNGVAFISGRSATVAHVYSSGSYIPEGVQGECYFDGYVCVGFDGECNSGSDFHAVAVATVIRTAVCADAQDWGGPP